MRGLCHHLAWPNRMDDIFGPFWLQNQPLQPLTLWSPHDFRDFWKKNHLNTRGFAWEVLRSGMLYRSGKSLKRCGKSSSLHSKKNFLLEEVRVFCEWCHKWRTFRPPWTTFPGPGRQPLGGSISLKFLLETRLQSESWYFGWPAGVSGSKVVM